MHVNMCMHSYVYKSLKKVKTETTMDIFAQTILKIFSSVSWLINFTFNFVSFSQHCRMKQDLENECYIMNINF